MKKLLLVALAIFVAFGTTLGQTSPASAKDDDDILKSIAKLDMLYFFLPLTMTKGQLKEILPVIEKYRGDIKKIKKIEDDELKKIEAEVRSIVKAGLDEGKVPNNDIRSKINTLFQKFDLNRKLNDDIYADKLYEVCTKVWNNGQKKIAAQTLNPQSYDPAMKPDQMSDDDKIKVFIRQILMSPAAYDVLVQLSFK